MSSSLLEAAFAHHVWATLRVVDACLDLSTEELETNVTGTRGPILETVRHVVESDAFDLYILTGDRAYNLDAGRMSLSEVRGVMERTGSGWTKLISGPLDPDAVVREVDESDGSDFGSRGPWTTAPTIAAKSVQPSRRSTWSRRRSA